MLCQQAHSLFFFPLRGKILESGRTRTAHNLGSKTRDSAATLGTRFISCVSRSARFSRKK